LHVSPKVFHRNTVLVSIDTLVSFVCCDEKRDGKREARVGFANADMLRVWKTSGPAAFPACSFFLNGTEGTIKAELTALAAIGYKNHYLIIELKQGPAT
jgi:hypothetical protein